MSANAVSSSTTYNLGSLTGGGIQITGLASGLNTDQIIQEEMAIYSRPVINLQHQQTGLQAQNTALTSIQSELQTLMADAQALGSSSLFAATQTVSTSDPTRVGAAMSAAGSGAGVGGYQVSVTQMANAARRTFTYSSPTADDTLTIDNQKVTVKAGTSISDFVSQINSNSSLTVYAAATASGTVVLSNRATGNTGTGYIAIGDASPTPPSTPTLTENTTLAHQGQNAQFTVDGVSGQASSNTVTNAIAGVTLTLSGVTTTSGPVTVNVGAPGPSTSAATSAVNTFIAQYNKVLGDVQTQLSTRPSSSDPTVGTLYGDPGLSGLLSSLRSLMYSTTNPTATSIHSMLDIGVSTGASTGIAPSQAALNGNLQLDPAKLTSALQSSPLETQQMLASWATQFTTLVGAQANTGGSIDARIQGDNGQVTQLGNQISTMQAALTDKQNQLVQQFAQLEAALSSNQSQSSWLTSQIAALPGA